MKQLYVPGRKDGVLRRVQHLPQSHGEPKTPAPETPGGHYLMLLGDPSNAEIAIINESRIITKKVDGHGMPA